ncbi:MAG: hypothetical protein J6D28_01935 [Bacilli bacterium]|nr:hypothetical protein [Bacilli bacterium]
MEKKSYELLKIIGITFLFFVILTWFIPTGSFSGGEFVKGDVSPIGLYGIFSSPVYSFAVFAQYFVLLLCVGGFYGILNKTHVYQRIVAFFGKCNKTKFLIATILINALITSLFGETMVIVILLPFFITVLLRLGYDKITSVASTIGASLIGGIASIFGNLAIYKNYFKLEGNTGFIINIIMFIIIVFLFIMYVLGNLKKSGTKVEKIEIPLFVDKKDNKKSVVPLCIILGLIILLIILGLYNWHYAFGLDIFNTLHEKLTTIELFGMPIISRIFGNFSEVGYFSNYDLSALLVLGSCLIAWIYGIKLGDAIDSFRDGVKKMLLPATYVVLASTIFSCIVTANSGNISLTISNFILGLSSDFNVLTGSLSALSGSLFYNDYLYFMNGLYGIISLYNTNMMPVILFVFQSMFGLMMFVLPVSITLIYGLKYLNVSYVEWIKYIWKFLLQIFLICIIGSIIFGMLI